MLHWLVISNLCMQETGSTSVVQVDPAMKEGEDQKLEEGIKHTKVNHVQ